MQKLILIRAQSHDDENWNLDDAHRPLTRRANYTSQRRRFFSGDTGDMPGIDIGSCSLYPGKPANLPAVLRFPVGAGGLCASSLSSVSIAQRSLTRLRRRIGGLVF